MEGKIRKAVGEDAEQISRIAEENGLKVFRKVKKQGFLVSDYSKEDYVLFINTCKYFYVLECNGAVKAFLFTYDQEELPSNSIVNVKIKNMAKHDFILIKQICVDAKEQNKGYGKMLYEYLMNTVNVDIFAAVVMQPKNIASDEFHKELGFQCIGLVQAEDGMKRGIYYWEHPQNMDCDNDILTNQYEMAIQLYQHEDNLNWSKLNNYLYMTGGLTFILSFIDLKQYIVALTVISLLGLLVSMIFYISIKSGIEYMQERKRAVTAIEKRLYAKKDGIYIVTDFSKKMIKSHTIMVMKLIPIGGLLVWLIILVVSMVLIY